MIQNPYLVLARKYRPNCFSQLQGQVTLVRTLTHAIRRKQLAHAYLLTGSHGIGKTTIARILAKIINCSDVVISSDGVKACGTCQSCTLIQNNNHPDQLEIDAASHTGVEDIRIITDHIEYKPLQGKYRVFIIDEVHMLSKSAFNALLKTLEEPPPHIIFIFATTEVHKLPLTVVSRCQRFDLRRLKIEDLMQLLIGVCKKEGVGYEEQALQIIANSSDGSARDALSVLDQVCTIAATERGITTSLVESILGRASTNTVVELLSAILKCQSERALCIAGELYQANVDLIWLNRSLLELVHYLSRLKLIPDYSLPLFAPYQEALKPLAHEAKLAHLTHLWQLFITGDEEIKSAFNPLLATEMLIIKAIYAMVLPSPHQLATSLIEQGDSKLGPNGFRSEQIQVALNKNSAPASSTAALRPRQPTVDSSREDSDEVLSDFLKYVYERREIELYYYLMNETDIKISGSQLIIIGTAMSRKSRELMQALLGQWDTKNTWQLKHEASERFISFKQRLTDKFTKSSFFQRITSTFPQAELADIMLDNPD